MDGRPDQRNRSWQLLAIVVAIQVAASAAFAACPNSPLFTDHSGFENNWTLANATKWRPIVNQWVINPGNDPQVLSPALTCAASDFNYMRLGFYNYGTNTSGQVFFRTGTDFVAGQSVNFTNPSRPERDSWLTVRLDNIPGWTGTIQQLRVDPVAYGSGGGDSIAVLFFYWRKDDQAPTFRFVTVDPPGWTNGAISLAIGGQDPAEVNPVGPDVYGSGCVGFNLLLSGWNNDAWTYYPRTFFDDFDGRAGLTLNFPAGSLAAGAHPLQVQAKDLVGHWSTEIRAATLYYDPISPTISFSGPAPGYYRSDQGVSFTVGDAHSGINRYCVWWDNGAPGCVAGTSWSSAINAAGAWYTPHTLHVVAYDNAGNSASADYGPWTFGPNRCPYITGPGPGVAQIVNEGATLSFNVAAADPDGDPVAIRQDGLPLGATFDGTTFRWTPGYSGQGDYQACFIPNDGSCDGPRVCIPIHVNDVASTAVQVLYPNGGERLVVGSPEYLRWSVSGGVGSRTTDVLLSRAGSAGPFETIASGLTGVTSLDWIVTGPPSSQCFLKVVAHDEAGTNYDLSDQAFTISAPLDTVIWCREQRVAGGSRVCSSPDLAVDERGVHVVWADRAPDAEDGVVRYLRGFRNYPDDSLSWTDGAALSTGTGNSNPSVVAGTEWAVAGPVHTARVAWSQSDGSGVSRIWCRGWGGSWLPADEVRSLTGEAEAPRVVGSIYGAKMVWWESAAGQAAIASSEWEGSWTTPMNLSQGPYRSWPDLATGAGSRMYAVWAAGAVGAEYVSYDRWEGTWGSEGSLSASLDVPQDPKVTVDATGRVHVAWAGMRSGHREIYWTLFDGLAWSPAIPVSEVDGMASETPDLVADDAGRVHLVWADTRDGNSEIYHRIFDGNGWEPPVRVTNATGTSTAPRITCEGRRFDIAWIDERAGSPAVYWRRGTVCTSGGLCDDEPTPTLASLVESRVVDGAVRLRWLVSGGVDQVAVYRMREGEAWAKLEDRWPDGMGYVDLRDASVESGSRYAYRIGLQSKGSEAFTEEVWVEIPSLVFSLEGVRPNPAPGGALIVRFALPTPAAATLELFDVGGRQLLRRDVGALGVGWHQVDVRPGGPLTPGVYVIRLTQAGKSASAKAAVIK